MASGVVHALDPDGTVRIGIGDHTDWLGPGVPVGGAEADGWQRSVAASQEGLLLTLETTDERRGVSTGSFTDPLLGWRFSPGERIAGGIPEGTRAVGFQVAEFAFPTRSTDVMATWPLLPHRPQALGLLLLVAPDGTTLLVGPASDPHSVAIAVGDGHVGIGWHGDLDDLPAGYRSSLCVIAADGPGAALDRWAERFAVGDRPGRYADALGRRISYWTDNGASYWYRTEPGHTVTSGIAATVADLDERGVPIGAVQVDSWWYPHEVLRPFDTDDWIVPPTGMLRWEARDDILPDGLAPLRDAVGGRPLAAHCRHLAASSPYVDEAPCWVDGDRAHPSTPELYQRLLDHCVAEGIETFEHDWLVECFTGVRQLRAHPHRPWDWLEGINAAAGRRGLTLQWCMATLADMVAASSLPRVTSVRTSGDHGYLAGPGFLWAWFLLVNRIARPLGLHPFKDVFLAGSELAAVDALLSVLSTGPVGIGDRLGQADPAVLQPCHRGDGLLVKPDVPVAATDAAFRDWPFGRHRPLVGDTWSDHPAGRWRFVVALNPDDRGAGAEALDIEVPVDVDGPFIAWDWRARTATPVEPGDVLRAGSLAPHDWRYWVLAPVVGGVAVVGDQALYATAGDMRTGRIDAAPGGGVRVTILGAGERVELACWSADRGAFVVPVDVPRGWVTVVVEP